jgi:nucleotide-binding universal stress UspA family protein
MQRTTAMWNKILCAVDFSPGSREALRVAAKEAATDGAELIVVHAWTPPVVYMGELVGLPASIIADMCSAAERELAAWKTEVEGYEKIRVQAVLLTGHAWHEVTEYAKANADINLIVVGTHGRTGIKHALLGSVAEKIVRHSPCAVLVVPPHRS